MRVISITKERILLTIYVLIIIFGVVISASSESVTTFSMPVSKKIVLIDAGHGGPDSGKTVGKVLEKDINLQISMKLQNYLEQGGSTVLMTRADDNALASSKKGDMWNRKSLANESSADIYVSIHQNSYTSNSVKGAQVFYFDNSVESKKLADCIQNELKTFVDPGNNKQTKSNANYYVLRKTLIPAVIVECGFLTNPSERLKLQDDSYQDKVAWAIYVGIVKYFNESAQSSHSG